METELPGHRRLGLGRVLLVDQVKGLMAGLGAALREAGFVPAGVQSAHVALGLSVALEPAALVLDDALPDLPPPDVWRRLRAEGPLSGAGVVLVGERPEEEGLEHALSCGADDYVTKPLRLRHLVLRIRALVRRFRAPPSSLPASVPCPDPASHREPPPAGAPSGAPRNVLRWRTLEIDPVSRRARVGGAELPLRRAELDLLVLLLRDATRIHTREEILERVCGRQAKNRLRTIDVLVRRLRARLGRLADLVRTHRGQGYSLADP